MINLLRKHLISLLLILVAAGAVGLMIHMERKVQATTFQYCNDPCDNNCWT